MGRVPRSDAAGDFARSVRTPWAPSGGTRSRWAYVVALTLFAGVLAFSLEQLRSVSIHWPWLVLTAAGAVATLLLNGLEMELTARLTGRSLGVARSLRVALLASAANLLPLPGGVVVRMRALTEDGSRAATAAWAAGTIAATWFAVSCAGAGLVLLGSDGSWPGVSFLALATILAVGTAWVGRRRLAAGWGLLGVGCVLEAVFVLVSAVRILAVLRGLGLEAGWTEGIVLAVASAAASAVGVFPAGLGLREALTGALGYFVAVGPAAAALAAVVDRIVGVGTLAVGSVLLFGLSGGRKGRLRR